MKEYYLGLDMGTNSIGWAVTDTNYNLIKVRRKDFWGVREFDEASPAVDRRSHRISRRRRQREQVRMGLVRGYFDDCIKKEDELFFVRLDNSKYHVEDMDAELQGKQGIFVDDNYNDSDYFAEYPTIYHLRKALIENTVEVDNKYCRLVYLAINNMFKHRGHFLNASLSDRDKVVSISELYPFLVEKIRDLLGVSFPEDTNNSLESILSDRTKSKTVKSENIMQEFGFDKKDKIQHTIIRALCGRKVNGKDIFVDVETEEKIEIDFSDFAYEEKKADIQALVGDDYFELIDIMKQIYDAGMLAGILHGEPYLSVSRVQEYNKHQLDLKLLKDVYKDYRLLDEYNYMFRDGESGSYSAYVNSTISSRGKNRRTMGSRTREDLYKTIQKHLKGIDDTRVSDILEEMANETFLPKQLTRDNGVIPNQVHKMEMEAILNNAEKYLPFLKEVDESGLTTKERIIKLFSFQIPYYIGPTSENSAKNKGNGWVIRKEAGPVLPWNFEEKIDVEKTQQEFIKRLIRDCSYINGEKVLPKASLEYEAYCVLNEINNIKIDGERINVELKQNIYKELFCKGKKVTRKNLESYLFNQGVIVESGQLSGVDVAINNSLASYGKFYSVFGEKINEDYYQSIAEQIIELATIYGDSKKTLKSIIEKKYSDVLDDIQIKRILGFKFKDWGRLSKAFLELQGCNKETGEVVSLIRALWDTSYNMMELINSEDFTFKEELEQKTQKALGSLAEFKAEDLDEFYFSAPVKRMVWQTISLIQEIEKIMGCAPTRVFIEMTRNNDEKQKGQRKNSRGKQLAEFYKSVKDDSKEWVKEILEADAKGTLKSKKLYLYYMQMGRCMYTGEPIELSELFTIKYDIDHIYPRHFVKDDNISNNLVLVNKASNAYKSDNYPLEKMKPEVYDLWHRLHEMKTANGQRLLSDEKYRRLTGKSPLTDEQKAGFIARQLVETSQGTKGVADLLKQLLPTPETTIVYAKASNVSDFRNGAYADVPKNCEFEQVEKILFKKARTLNDFHHAKDAYLNIVVGNVYYTKFTQNPLHFIRKELAMDEKKYHYNLGRMYAWKVERNGVVAWVPGEEGTIKTVKKVMAKNTPLMTRLTFEATGAIANETLYSADKAKPENYIPLKSRDSKMQDVKKYGGFTSVSGAYFFVVEHDVKKERIRTFEVVPIYMKHKVEATKDGLEKYCMDELGLKNPRILVQKVKMQSLMEINGFRYRLSGRTGKQLILRNEVQLCLNLEWNNYIHDIEKFISGDKDLASLDELMGIQLYDVLLKKHTEGIFGKRINSVGKILMEGRERFIALSLEEQCKILSQILQLSVIGPTTADLVLIGGKGKSGVMLHSNNISKERDFCLINQSVTGVYEEKINLLEL